MRERGSLIIFLTAVGVMSLGLALIAGQTKSGDDKPGDDKSDTKIAPYYPTPNKIVEKMLELGGLKPGEKMWDLGSGDGRIVIMAARKFKANAYGVELDEMLAKQSAARIASLGLTPTAHIIQGDLLEQDYSSADLLTIYLLPVAIEKVTPILEKQLKKGARVVAHDFEFSAVEGGEGRGYRRRRRGAQPPAVPL